MIRHLMRPALLTIGILPAAMAAPAPEPQALVHAWIENERGQPAADLRIEDFEVYVDGVTVPLQSLSPSRTSASVIVLLDTSRTVRWNAQRLAGHIGEFAASLAPHDELMIATFGGHDQFRAFKPAGQYERDEVLGAIEVRGDRGYGASPIWDSLHQAVTLLAGRRPPRSIVLLTDGRATGNRHSLAEAADHAMANDVAVNVIAKHSARQIRQSGAPAGSATGPASIAVLVQPSAPLKGFASYTGGQFFTYPELPEAEATTIFSFTASAVRGLHAFVFTPSSRDGAAHRLGIRSRRPGFKVHAPLAFVAH
jgi:hypothetical protein